MTKNYMVVFAKCTGSNFSGHAPDVPGCVSAGDTLEEMQRMMREALELHLEALHDDGQPMPEPVTESVDFKTEDFEDVEYFIVQKLAVSLPGAYKTTKAHQAA